MIDGIPTEAFWAVGTVLAAALAMYGTTYATRHKPDTVADITEAAGDVVALYKEQMADYEVRLTHLEKELALSEKERVTLLKWNSALLEQVLALGKVPVTLEDIRHVADA